MSPRSLAKWNIDPGVVELELTETVLMEASPRLNDALQRLRQMGLRIAIDDFGTGFSSLKYLTVYPINRLKIAQDLVFGVSDDARNAAVVRAAIRLAHELGIEVIAEGVETEAQASFLSSAGCDNAQGYLYSRPLDATAATALLLRSPDRWRDGAEPGHGSPAADEVMTARLMDRSQRSERQSASGKSFDDRA